MRGPYCCPTRLERGALLLVALSLMATAGCGSGSEASAAVRPAEARQIIVAVDFSGSRTPAELERSQEMIAGLVRSLVANDQMVVMPVASVDIGRRRSPSRLHTIPLPKTGQRRDERRIVGAREDVLDDVKRLFDERESMSRSATDLLATLFQVRDYVLEAGTRRVNLVLLSDMAHGAGGMNFSREAGVPTDAWLARQKSLQLIPSLPKACVTVVGADSSTPAGVARRTFWQKYFEAAGGQLTAARYRLSLTQFDGALCDK